jgi:hypothetical protein
MTPEMRIHPTVEQWCEASGISLANARDAAENPTRTEVIECNGAFLQFFLKQITTTSPGSWILGVIEQAPPQPAELSVVLRVFDGFVADMEQMEPSELLRAFVDRFGVDVTLGTIRRRLFMAESLPMSQLRPALQVHSETQPAGALILGSTLARFEEDPRRAICILVFAANVTALGEYVASNTASR